MVGLDLGNKPNSSQGCRNGRFAVLPTTIGRGFCHWKSMHASIDSTEFSATNIHLSSTSVSSSSSSSSSFKMIRSPSLFLLLLKILLALVLGLQGAFAFSAPAASVQSVISPPGIIRSSILHLPRSTTSASTRCYAFRRRQHSSSSPPSASENACIINDPSEKHNNKKSSGGGTRGGSNKRVGWRRRVISRLVRGRNINNNKRRNGRPSLLSLESTATADDIEATETTTTTTTTVNTNFVVDEFILENFDRLSPEQLFATLENSQYTLEVNTSDGDGTGTAEVVDSYHHSGPFFEPPLELPVVTEQEEEEEEEEKSITTASSLYTNETTKVEVSAFPITYEDDQGSQDDELLLDCAMPISLIGSTSSFEGGPPVRKMVRNWFQSLLTNCFRNWAAEEPVNLHVRCSPTGNVLGQLLRGQLHCNARAEFDRLVLNFLRLQGGTIEGSRLALNLLAFTVDRSKGGLDADSSSSNITNFMCNNYNKSNVHKGTKTRKKKKKNNNNDHKEATSSKPIANHSPQRQRIKPRRHRLLEAKKMLPRYQTQFELHAHDCILTQEDLFESSCVRNGLQNLLKRILKQKGILTKSVLLTDISILETSDKLAIHGEATVMHGPTLSFEVRSGIAFKNRGHVVTFPGLELSLRSRTNSSSNNNQNNNSNNMFMAMGGIGSFFVPLPEIELDIGHNARLRECTLDGQKKHIKVAASVTITPQHTLKLSNEYRQSSRAYSAQFSCDVGRWLTRIGRFSL